jgi:hypothetical protein
MKPSKVIRISNETYTDLARKGTLADTFDTVIQRLLIPEKTETSEKLGQAIAESKPQIAPATRQRSKVALVNASSNNPEVLQED